MKGIALGQACGYQHICFILRVIFTSNHFIPRPQWTARRQEKILLPPPAVTFDYFEHQNMSLALLLVRGNFLGAHARQLVGLLVTHITEYSVICTVVSCTVVRMHYRASVTHPFIAMSATLFIRYYRIIFFKSYKISYILETFNETWKVSLINWSN